MTATVSLVRRFLVDYGRRPLNVVLLVVVPVVFVALAATAIVDFVDVVGGPADPDVLAAPTAGWAAAFLAGVAGFFLVQGSRAPDRRLADAGMGGGRVAVARLTTGLLLAFAAAFASLAALVVRTTVSDPLRALVGTAMFAVIYLGIGVAVGAVVADPVNGSLLVVFVWMIDVFLGPAMAGGSVLVARVFPTHFVTLVTMNAASGHAGPIGDIGWALVWTVGSVVVAFALFARTTGTRLLDHRPHLPAPVRRVVAAFGYGLRDYRRNTVMWVLLALLPVGFITLSFYVTPADPAPVRLVEDGVDAIRVLSMADVHGAIMVPITVAFLAGLTGLFVVQGSLEADHRLTLAGFRPREILAARFGIILLGAALTTVVSLATTAIDFRPAQWPAFAWSNALVAITYGLVGVLIGTLFGKLGGLYVMFLLPFIDVGLAQNVMFSAVPPDWGRFLPARGAVQILVDAAFTSSFDTAASLVLASAWIVALGLAAVYTFRRITSPSRV